MGSILYLSHNCKICYVTFEIAKMYVEYKENLIFLTESLTAVSRRARGHDLRYSKLAQSTNAFSIGAHVNVRVYCSGVNFRSEMRDNLNESSSNFLSPVKCSWCEV